MTTRVRVELDHRTAFIDTDLDTYKSLQDFWSFAVPGAHFSDKVADGIWDGRIRMLKRRKVPAGLFRATYVECAQTVGVIFDIHEDLPDEEFAAAEPITDPKYIHQHHCVSAMCKAVPHGGGLVIAATSAGKTRIAAMLMARMPEKKFLFVVDQLNLLYQAQKDIAAHLDSKIGVVGESVFAPSRITVATIQTLRAHSKRKDFKAWMQSMDVVIVDEIHEQMAKSTFKVMDVIEPLAVFGLTATLQLGKKPIRFNAWAFAGPVIFTFTIEEGMQKGVLQQGIVLQLIFDNLNTDAYNNKEDYEFQVMSNKFKHRAAYWITHYLIDQHKRHVVQLVDRLDHLDAMHEIMHDVSHVQMFGGVAKEAREDGIELFEDGVIPLLIANKVLKKGVSINIIDAIIDMAERKSKDDAIQKFGRGLRQHEDQVPLLYIDFGTAAGKSALDALSKASKSRAREFKKQGISIQRVRVHTIKEALRAVQAALKGQKKEKINASV